MAGMSASSSVSRQLSNGSQESRVSAEGTI
jgi:hypothetical protein